MKTLLLFLILIEMSLNNISISKKLEKMEKTLEKEAPTEYLEKLLTEKRITKNKLKHELNISEKELKNIFKNKKINNTTSKKLEKIFKIPSNWWLRNQKIYEKQKNKN